MQKFTAVANDGEFGSYYLLLVWSHSGAAWIVPSVLAFPSLNNIRSVFCVVHVGACFFFPLSTYSRTRDRSGYHFCDGGDENRYVLLCYVRDWLSLLSLLYLLCSVFDLFSGFMHRVIRHHSLLVFMCCFFSNTLWKFASLSLWPLGSNQWMNLDIRVELTIPSSFKLRTWNRYVSHRKYFDRWWQRGVPLGGYQGLDHKALLTRSIVAWFAGRKWGECWRFINRYRLVCANSHSLPRHSGLCWQKRKSTPTYCIPVFRMSSPHPKVTNSRTT